MEVKNADDLKLTSILDKKLRESRGYRFGANLINNGAILVAAEVAVWGLSNSEINYLPLFLALSLLRIAQVINGVKMLKDVFPAKKNEPIKPPADWPPAPKFPEWWGVREVILEDLPEDKTPR